MGRDIAGWKSLRGNIQGILGEILDKLTQLGSCNNWNIQAQKEQGPSLKSRKQEDLNEPG